MFSQGDGNLVTVRIHSKKPSLVESLEELSPVCLLQMFPYSILAAWRRILLQAENHQQKELREHQKGFS